MRFNFSHFGLSFSFMNADVIDDDINTYFVSISLCEEREKLLLTYREISCWTQVALSDVSTHWVVKSSFFFLTFKLST